MSKETWLSITLSATVASLLHISAALADTEAVQKMAKIVISLNHYPTSEDKKILKTIAEKGSPTETTIANALLNMEHRVTPTDRARLNEIVKDSSQPVDARNLALILKDINHKASAAEKKKLSEM